MFAILFGSRTQQAVHPAPFTSPTASSGDSSTEVLSKLRAVSGDMDALEKTFNTDTSLSASTDTSMMDVRTFSEEMSPGNSLRAPPRQTCISPSFEVISISRRHDDFATSLSNIEFNFPSARHNSEASTTATDIEISNILVDENTIPFASTSKLYKLHERNNDTDTEGENSYNGRSNNRYLNDNEEEEEELRVEQPITFFGF